MEWLPVLLPFVLVCFFVCAVIQRRSPLAWYAGWVFLFLAAGAVCVLATSQLYYAESGVQQVGPAVFLIGGMAFWVGGASLWATYRGAFFPVCPLAPSPPASVPPAAPAPPPVA